MASYPKGWSKLTARQKDAFYTEYNKRSEKGREEFLKLVREGQSQEREALTDKWDAEAMAAAKKTKKYGSYAVFSRNRFVKKVSRRRKKSSHRSKRR